jgi:hypothetical protein
MTEVDKKRLYVECHRVAPLEHFGRMMEQRRQSQTEIDRLISKKKKA